MSFPLLCYCPVGLIHHTKCYDVWLPHLHPCFCWLLEERSHQLEMSLWSNIVSFCFLLQKYGGVWLRFTCETDEHHITEFTGFSVTGLYPCRPLTGTWGTLKTQSEAVAFHQTWNQIQLKEKGPNMLPVCRLVGIPFTWFAEGCSRERFSTGEASLKEGLKGFYCITLDLCHLLKQNSWVLWTEGWVTLVQEDKNRDLSLMYWQEKALFICASKEIELHVLAGLQLS